MTDDVKNTNALLEEMFSQAVTLRNQGRFQDAISLLRQLLSRQPTFLRGAMGLAELLAETHQFDEAIIGFQYVFSLNPTSNTAMRLGVLLATQGQYDKAIEWFYRAIQMDPHSAIAHRYLGLALTNRHSYAEAIERLQTAIGLEPRNVESFMLLGNAFSALKKYGDAEKCFSTAVGFEPENPMTYVSLGTSVANQDRTDEALECFWKALAIDPQCRLAHINAGFAYDHLGQLDNAKDSFSKAIEITPNDNATRVCLGVILDRLGEVEQAEDCFRTALTMDPNHIPARFNLGMLQLRKGDWLQGWEAYELRTELPGAKKLSTSKPRWNGEPLIGKRILVIHEQGVGDSIQFARYLNLLKQQGARVLLNCRKSMRRLLVSCDGVDEFFPLGDPYPYHDFHIPLLSLPRAFKTTPSTIPNQVPYLHPEPDLVAAWKERLSRDKGFKVGMIWRGNPAFGSDKYRSIDLKHFELLNRTGNIQFYNLQKEDVHEEIESVRDLMRIHSFGDELDQQAAFVDTAAIMQNLNLIISVDSAPAHLAGAIGVPVWLLLSYNNHWTWLMNRTDSPWYPTMRIYRQEKSREWKPVLEKIAVDLEQRVAKG